MGWLTLIFALVGLEDILCTPYSVPHIEITR